MNRLTVRKIDIKSPLVNSLSALMDQEKIEYHSINQLNWEEYPYHPEVRFRIAHTDQAILLNYQVEEERVRARHAQDNGSVWTDSCVEFFVMPVADGVYYNIECSCIGTVLVGMGKDRHGRVHASQEVMSAIQRWASLGNKSFEEREGKCVWELSLVIPYSVFFNHSVDSMDGVVAKGNFYKCGDELKTPHFLSWNKIETMKPDFHRSDFFGELNFE